MAAFYDGLVVSLLTIVGMMAFWGIHVRRRVDDALGQTPVGMEEAVRHSCARGFTLVELLIVVAAIAIIAGIAIPGLLRSRLTANEASAIGSMRAVTNAQVSYAASCGGGGFAQSLSDLALAPPGGVTFVDSGIATGTRTGYQFSVAPDPSATTVLPAASTCNGSTSASGYFASGLPLTVGLTGQRSFATDSRGAIYQEPTGTAIANPIPSSTQVVQ